VNKEQLQDAIGAMQDEADAGLYHDELETLLALVNKASGDDIAAAWKEISEID